MSRVNILLFYSAALLVITEGFPVDQDHDSDSSEYGSYFEGDMILDTNQINAILFPNGRNGLIKGQYKWPNNSVFYEIDPVFGNR